MTSSQREGQTMQRRHFTKAPVALTKNDMARVIVQALYFLPTLPAADDKRVKVRARLRKSEIADYHRRALDIINDGMSNRSWPTA